MEGQTKERSKQPKGLATEQRGNKMWSSPEMSEHVTVKRNELHRYVHTYSDETQRRKPQWLSDKEWKRVCCKIHTILSEV